MAAAWQETDRGLWQVAAGEASYAVRPCWGGRICSLAWRGQELLFPPTTPPEPLTPPFPGENLAQWKRRLGFRLWGGDKVWLAPQQAWVEGTPPQDLDCGSWQVGASGSILHLLSPVCRETGLCIERRLTAGTDSLEVRDSLVNHGREPQRRGIWLVAQLSRPGSVTFAAHSGTLRPYPWEGRSEELFPQVVQEQAGQATILCREAGHFKVGAMLDSGEVRARLILPEGPQLELGWRFALANEGDYAHNAAVEVYNSPDQDYFEMEVHAPLRTLKAGERQEFTRSWTCTALDQG